VSQPNTLAAAAGPNAGNYGEDTGGNTLRDIIGRSNGKLGSAFDWGGMGLRSE
jgi:hypothetical protein